MPTALHRRRNSRRNATWTTRLGARMYIFREGRHGKNAGERATFLRPLRIVAAGDRRDADEEKDGCGCARNVRETV